MTQGELKQIPQPFVELMSELEMRIMKDIIERIKANGFLPASADWEISRLRQLGESEEQIRKWIKEMLEKTDDEVDKVFSNDVYREYYGHDREYQVSGFEQIPLEQNVQLLQVIEASKRQTKDTFKNLTGSTGFAIRDPATGNIMYSPTMKFYQQTLDAAIMDIKSGAFSYNTVLARTINTMTTSGLRWIDYDSGWHNRVDVAARRAVMTGFRQVQGKINEQVAEELKTDTYEVTYHVGARPTHQPWQGRVWTMQQLIDVCGLGTVTGLHGANCYHDYKPFIPGVSVRTYTDEQLDQMIAEENTPKEYLGKKYTTYEALQAQRRMETRMRKTRQDIRLMQDGGADPNDVVLKKAKYQGQMQTYKAFSEAMELPEQMERVYQDGLRGKFTPTKSELARVEKSVEKKSTSDIIEMTRKISDSREGFKFISDKTFDNLTIAAKKKGAVILRGTEEVERHLDSMNAAASNLNDILFFRKNVCISEVLEETHHFEQNLMKMNDDKGEPLRSILNEIDAKQYLLDNAKKYKIPRNEIELTKKQLASYQQQLKEITGE